MHTKFTAPSHTDESTGWATASPSRDCMHVGGDVMDSPTSLSSLQGREHADHTLLGCQYSRGHGEPEQVITALGMEAASHWDSSRSDNDAELSDAVTDDTQRTTRVEKPKAAVPQGASHVLQLRACA